MRLTFTDFVREQLANIPPVVTSDLKGNTVMVVGANTGLGFQALIHFARMNPARLILACRSPSKGKAAVERLTQETGYRSAELWNVDFSRFSSVKEFSDKFHKDGGRLDILVLNAAIAVSVYEETSDGWESSVQVNDLSPSLLALLLLPQMIHTSKEYGTTPRIVVVSSEVHFWVTVPEDLLESPNIVEIIGSQEYCTKSGGMSGRYPLSKLINVFFVRALSERLPLDSPQTPIVNAVNPGYCYSELRRSFRGVRAAVDWLMEKALAHTSEEGSRQLVWAAVGGTGSEDTLRGAYISASEVQEPSDAVLGDEGRKLQNKIWDDMLRILVKVDPRVQEIVEKYLITPT